MHTSQRWPALCGGGALLASSTYFNAFAVALSACVRCGSAAHTRRGNAPRNITAAVAPPASFRNRRRLEGLSSVMSVLLGSATVTGHPAHGTPVRSKPQVFSVAATCYIQ